MTPRDVRWGGRTFGPREAAPARRFAREVARHWERRLPGLPMPRHWRRAAVCAYLESRRLARSRRFVASVASALEMGGAYESDRERYVVFVAAVCAPAMHALFEGMAARRRRAAGCAR